MRYITDIFAKNHGDTFLRRFQNKSFSEIMENLIVFQAYYAINFCDRGEFPDDKLTSTYGLERIDYFIWNASCSDAFFQCSIGQTFQLKCPGQSQAFDKETVNCNFRNSVKVCPEYDHVMHCSKFGTCNRGLPIVKIVFENCTSALSSAILCPQNCYAKYTQSEVAKNVNSN